MYEIVTVDKIVLLSLQKEVTQIFNASFGGEY